jgi:hypothetical protein
MAKTPQPRALSGAIIEKMTMGEQSRPLIAQPVGTIDTSSQHDTRKIHSEGIANRLLTTT